MQCVMCSAVARQSALLDHLIICELLFLTNKYRGTTEEQSNHHSFVNVEMSFLRYGRPLSFFCTQLRFILFQDYKTEHLPQSFT